MGLPVIDFFPETTQLLLTAVMEKFHSRFIELIILKVGPKDFDRVFKCSEIINGASGIQSGNASFSMSTSTLSRILPAVRSTRQPMLSPQLMIFKTPKISSTFQDSGV